ncbi:helix-turn-helix transcriptional regulator [Empedobacter sp. ULE_I145]
MNPSIKSSELSFCAMLYLNYSTKDIAEITFVTVRAVQIRKNRLRKKYNIDSDIDINKWMRNL